MTVAGQCIKRGLYVVLITAGLANWLVLLVPVMDATYVNAAPITAKPVCKNSLPQLDPVARAKVDEVFSRLPLNFAACPNGSPSRFRARTRGGTVYLSATEARFDLPSGACVKRPDCGADSGVPRNAGSQLAVHKLPGPRRDQAASRTPHSAELPPPSSAVRMQLIAGNPPARIRGADELAGRHNYLIGNDPFQWRTNISTYARVQIENVYRGVDLVYYGHQREFEYDFKVAPGASYKAIRWRFDGAQHIRVEPSGDLLIDTAAGVIRQPRPLAYQEVKGARCNVKTVYVVNRKREVSFRLGAYDHRQPLVIDPVLSYSTYLGDNGTDQGLGIAVDTAGNAYVTGYTLSTDFPTTAGAFQKLLPRARFTAFVCKLNAAGTALVYSTYLGGSGNNPAAPVGDQAFAIAVDAAGNAYVTGSTGAIDFPTVNALQPALNVAMPSSSDAFIARLDATGAALVYSTYFGGRGNETSNAIAVNDAGNATITGETTSDDYPLKNAIQTQISRGQTVNDAFIARFIARFNAAGNALTYSTYFGGKGTDGGSGVALDVTGNAYVTGFTGSTNLPTVNAWQAANQGGPLDGFVLKLALPRIIAITAEGKKLVVSGEGFDSGRWYYSTARRKKHRTARPA